MDLHSLAHKIALSPCPFLKLGLKPDCRNVEEIERAYKLRARVLHPDKWRNGGEEAKNAFIALRHAYDEVLSQSRQKQQHPQHAAGAGQRGQRSWWEGYADADDFDLPVAVPGSYWVAPALAQVKSVGQPPPRTAPSLARTNLASKGATKPQQPPKAPTASRHPLQQQDREAHGLQHADTISSSSGGSSASLEEQPGEAAAAAAPTPHAQQTGPLHAAYHRRSSHPPSHYAVNSLRQQLGPGPTPPKLVATGVRPGPIDQSVREHTPQHIRHSLDSRSALQLLQELHKPPASAAPVSAAAAAAAAAAAGTSTATPPPAPNAAATVAPQQPASSPIPKLLSASPLAHRQQRSRHHRLRPWARQADSTQQQQQQENGVDLQEDLEDDQDGVQQQQQVQQEVGQTTHGEQWLIPCKGQQSERHGLTPKQHSSPAQHQQLVSQGPASPSQPLPKVAAGGVLLPPTLAQYCAAPPQQQQASQQQQQQQHMQEHERLAVGQGQQVGAQSDEEPPSQQRHGHTLGPHRKGRLRGSWRTHASMAVAAETATAETATAAAATAEAATAAATAAAETAHITAGSELELAHEQLQHQEHQHQHQQHQPVQQKQQQQQQQQYLQHDCLQGPCHPQSVLQELVPNAQPPSVQGKELRQHQPHSAFLPKGGQHQASIEQLLGLLLPQPHHQRQPSSLPHAVLSVAAAQQQPPQTITTSNTTSTKAHAAAPATHRAQLDAPHPLLPSEAAPNQGPASLTGPACRSPQAPHVHAAAGTLAQRRARGQRPSGAARTQLLLRDACKQQEGGVQTAGGEVGGGVLASSWRGAHRQQEGTMEQGVNTGVLAVEGACLEDSMEEGTEGQRAHKRMRRLVWEDQEDEEPERDGDGEGLDEAEPVIIDDDEDDDAIEEVEPGNGMPLSRPSAAEPAHAALQGPGVASASSWRDQAQQSATAQAHKLAKERATALRRQFAGGRRSRGRGGASSAMALLRPISGAGSSRSSSGGHSGGSSSGHSTRGRGRGLSSNGKAGGRGVPSRGRGGKGSTQKSLAHFVCKRTALR